MITLFHAIQSLVPGAEVSVGIYDQKIEWHKPDSAPVTLEQIQAEQQRLQQAYNWDEYKRNRAREYPTIQEQLDALYHAGAFPPAMAARIRAVKEKYPRHSSEQTQTIEQTAPKMSVDEWLAEQTKMTAEQWLSQQQQTITPMTREEWLASQVEVKTTHNATPTDTVTVTRTMTAEQWLSQQQQQQTITPMTREQWLASQVEVKPLNDPKSINTVSVTRTITAEQWLQEQASLESVQKMTREQWLEQQKTIVQPTQMTREQWLAEQAKMK